MKRSVFTKFLICFFVLNVIALFYTMLVGTTAMADDLEHIHASWLVWNGEVPYRDFFEHHHSLMWYVFAPLVGVSGRNILIFYLLRFLMVLCSLLTLYIVFKLVKNYLADKTAAWLTVNIFCFSTVALNAMVQFKPDILMHLFYCAGTYYLFAFMSDKKPLYLSLMAFFYAISFLFLQTAIFLFIPIFGVLVYLLYKKEVSVRAILKASVLPLILLGCAVFFLWQNGSLQRYYELNWIVNAQISAELGKARIMDFGTLWGALICGLIAGAYLLFNKPTKALCMFLAIYACEFILRLTYISVYAHYFKMLILFNAVIIGVAVAKLCEWRSVWAYLVLALFVPAYFKVFSVPIKKVADEFQTTTILEIITDITNNTNEDDTVLGTAKMPFGIFNKNPHYYWFSWNYIGKIDAQLFNYASPFDINQILIEKQPKFVYFEDSLKPDYQPTGRYDIRPKLLSELYHTAKYNTLYQKKQDR